MADFIYANEGKDYVNTNGWPTTVYFALSTSTVDTLTAAVTQATQAEATGTGYARLSQARPTSSNGTLAFSQMSWSTGSATNWPASVKSVVAQTTGTGTAGKVLCVWNLQTGGAGRDMSGANTTENVTPSFTA